MVFKNMGIFYLHSMLGKAKVELRPSGLSALLNIGKILGLDPNDVLEDGSAINGMTLTPTPWALNRFVYFGTESSKFDPFFPGGKMPDRDPNTKGKNKDTNEFLSQSIDPVSTAVCPERLVKDDGESFWVSDCSPAVKWQHNGKPGDPNHLMRIRNSGTIFTWEKFEFYKAMRPVLAAFDDNGLSQLFLDLVEIQYRHWSTAEHGPECNKDGDFAKRPWQKYLSSADRAAHKVNPAFNPMYCNESGLSRYEPILAEAFVTDLIPAMGELVAVLDNPNFIVDDRNGGKTRNGLDILHDLTVAMFDPGYAAKVGVTDRFGKKDTTWTNGKIHKPQTTPFDLFAQALRGFDLAMEGSPRQARWRNGRSKLVDTFLAVDGDGSSAKFRNSAFIKSVPILVDVLRTQLNANCPDREVNPQTCPWATQTLAQKAAETIAGPTFSTTMHLVDAINEEPLARVQLERQLRYLMLQASGSDALSSMLTTSTDMMQMLSDDSIMPLIYNAIAVAAAPEEAKIDGKAAPGAADRVMEFMDAITRERNSKGAQVRNPYDPYRVMDRLLRNLFSPMDPADPASLTPVELFADTIAEVHRLDADADPQEPLSPDDLKAVFTTLRDFSTSPTRGMEANLRNHAPPKRNLNQSSDFFLMILKKTLGGAFALFALLASDMAWAGGLYQTDRGVRPLGRGGAFIAGADDLNAIAYNPAGLVFAKEQFLFDASWLQYKSRYQRKSLVRQVDPNTGQPTGAEWVQVFPEVEGTTPVLPLPTLAYSNSLGQKHMNFAVGLHAPYAAVTSFPKRVGRQPAPQRYSIISLEGSALAVLGAYGAFHDPESPFAFGAGIEMLTGFFQTSVYFSGCVPERFFCAPEQPEYDTLGRLRVGPIFAPSGILGAIFKPSKLLRAGLSLHLPFWIHSHAEQEIRLGSAAVFETAKFENPGATVDFRLPWTLRAGAELRPSENLRVEIGAGYEAWSMHDEIVVDPDNTSLNNVAGFPEKYFLPPLSIKREFQDSYSARLGGEFTFPIGKYKLGMRLGAMYETSAIPNEYLSATTIDLEKVVASIGGSLYLGKWRFDAVFAKVFGVPVEVDVREQRMQQINPLTANPPNLPHYINGGKYSVEANVVGLGLAYQFEDG